MKELGWQWVLQRLMGIMSLSEENKTHNQRLGSSPRSEFLDKLVIFDGVLPSAIVNIPQCFSLIFFRSPPSEGFTLLYSPPLFNPTVHLCTI